MRPTQRNDRPKVPAGRRRIGKGKSARGKVTLTKAVADEVRDNVRDITLGMNIEKGDVIRGVICGALIILYSVLQTTFFVRFAPFGAVPDLMLLLTVAMGISEGEKFASVTGLVSAFVINAVGTAYDGVSLLPLLYFAAGCAVGLLNKYVFGDTFPMKVIYVSAATFAKALYNTVFTARENGAPFIRVITDTVVPEFFSTLLLSLPVIYTVKLVYRYFHKSRAERTNNTI